MICPVCNEEYILEIQIKIEIHQFSFFSGYYSGGLSALLENFYFIFGEIGKMFDENPFIF